MVLYKKGVAMEEKIDTQVIENFMSEHGLCKKEFCKLCGISRYIFDKMMRDRKIIYAKTFIKIAKATNLTFAQLYTKKDG